MEHPLEIKHNGGIKLRSFSKHVDESNKVNLRLLTKARACEGAGQVSRLEVWENGKE
jgi:hypothetical protein